MDRAIHFCNLGMATIAKDGRLLFILSGQQPLLHDASADDEIARNRGGVIFWNGARAKYDEFGTDHAMFPPGCNVEFPLVGSARARRRYCR